MKIKKWFEQFPYPGWIGLILFFLLTSIIVYQTEKQQYHPNRLSQKIQKDFSARQAMLLADYESKKFNNYSDPDVVIPEAKEYYLFIVEQGQVINWNSNNISLPGFCIKDPAVLQSGTLLRLNQGAYYARSLQIRQVDSVSSFAIALIPIAFQYNFENRYFKSHFVADARIPPSTKINDLSNAKGWQIKNAGGQPVFYIHFTEDTLKLFVIGPWVWLLSIIFLFILFVWVHKCCLLLSKSRSPISGWLALLVFCLVCNWLRISSGAPLGFANATLFSPKLLASGNIIHSFPDLIISTLFDTWLFIYFIKYVSINEITTLSNRKANVLLKLSIIILLVIDLYQIQANSINRLVIDSKISFEVSDFTQLTGYTFLGIITLSLITLNFILILSIINELLKKLTSLKLVRYLVVFALSIACIYFLQDKEITGFYLVMLLMSLAGLLLLDAFGLPIQVFGRKAEVAGMPYNYLWFIILCSWITLEIFYFNYTKEKELRKVFANKQEQRDDALIAYAFDNLSAELQEDALVKTYWNNPSAQAQSAINRHIIYRYLGMQFKKFQANIYYYDKYRNPLKNGDSLDQILVRKADQLSGHRLKDGIVFLNHPADENIYWGIFPILNTAKKDTLGYLGFDFSMDKRPKVNYIASLLQQNYNPTDQQYFDKYTYGIYRNNTLWAQGGNQSFPFRSVYPNSGKEYVFKESLFSSTLYYRPSSGEFIQVNYERNILTNVISLFSYVLALLILLTGLLFLLTNFVYNPLQGKVWSRNSLNLTIRAKVNLTVLATVLLSLVVVGLITVSFLKGRYQETQQKNLQNLMFYFSQNIVHFIENKTLDFSNKNETILSIYPELSYLLNSLADEQGVDISLFNDQGKLIATSQSEMFQKGFLSPFMNRSVFQELRSGMKSELTVRETMGQLDYQSLYLPLRNNKDKIIAYLNLPYYASQTELRTEISNIMATLINIYTLIFFISGICAVLISNSIIKSFRLLIDQFRMIRLQHNVLIHWPHRDELGLLVKEYNAMIIKVEDMAAKLANTEREAAWRELALQVAHEIKNPLTPMKLNIQYLQQAIRSGRSDMGALTAKLTESLIEQIENMNVIATEFAHFAKMPDAQPEDLNVSDLLQSIVALFQKEEVTKIELAEEQQNLHVYMDKGYFLRIFTNLIKNALQAIPNDISGYIKITLSRNNHKVEIAVKDNGSGIPEAMQKQMFTPYFTTKSSGTGIGLAMSKNMIELSNGKIWFKTQAGKGTTFFVSLPNHIPAAGSASY